MQMKNTEDSAGMHAAPLAHNAAVVTAGP